MVTLERRRKETAQREERRLPRNHLAGFAEKFRFDTGIGRVAALFLLCVGGGASLAAWLKSELTTRPHPHPHSIIVGRVSATPDVDVSRVFRATGVVEIANASDVPAQRSRAFAFQAAADEKSAAEGIAQRTGLGRVPLARQPMTSGPRVAQASSRHGLPQRSLPAPTTKTQAREQTFMSTFAHH